jgi:hypothetical protein
LAVKILMTWDIVPGREQEYFEFVVREFVPGVQRLGFELTDAWMTAYGDQPQILVGASLPNLSKARQILRSTDWKNLQTQLMDLVTNFNQKIVAAHGGFQF